ncbi:MAG TPA: hypothetical protein ACFYDZ_04755 [Candidatus Brocadiaceae bacterium]
MVNLVAAMLRQGFNSMGVKHDQTIPVQGLQGYSLSMPPCNIELPETEGTV